MNEEQEVFDRRELLRTERARSWPVNEESGGIGSDA